MIGLRMFRLSVLRIVATNLSVVSLWVSVPRDSFHLFPGSREVTFLVVPLEVRR